MNQPDPRPQEIEPAHLVDPTHQAHADRLEALAAALRERGQGSSPVFRSIIETASSVEIGRTAEAEALDEHTRVAIEAVKNKEAQNRADYRLLTDFAGLLPGSTDTGNLGDRSILTSSLSDAKFAQISTIWVSELNSGAAVPHPMYILGRVKTGEGARDDGRVRFLVARSAFRKLTYGGKESDLMLGVQIDPKLYEVTTTKHDAELVDDLRALYASQSVEDLKADLGSDLGIDSRYVMPNTGTEMIYRMRDSKRARGVRSAINRHEISAARNEPIELNCSNITQLYTPTFNWDRYEGVEGRLAELAEAFGKTDELVQLYEDRARKVKPDPTLKYIHEEKS